MLKVVTGRFHPHLEAALVDHLRQVKTRDPFAPVAVVVPSKPLVDRLRHVLAVEHRLSVLNLHLLTFHQLALRLADETGTQSACRVVDDVFFEQLVRHIVRSGLSNLTPLHHIGHSSGTWAALWSTMRDLKDAGVDPAHALRGIEEGYFGEEDTAWLGALFSLHAAVKEAGKSLQLGTADDLAESLIPLVPESRFVTALSHVFYYGFYDLTQVQLSLLEAVSRTAPTTLLFPLDDQPAYRFARRFFDRYIRPLAPTKDSVVHPAPTDHQPHHRTSLAVRSTVGAEEELASTCRIILDLVETNGYGFEDIGVVARTLDPYRSLLQPIFDRHRIPFVTSVGRPLLHEPLCKTLLQLASIPLNDGYRTAVMDVITSPLYRSEALTREHGDVRPDLWILAVSALHVTRGADEWARLEAASRASLEVEEAEENHNPAGPVPIPPSVLQHLWQTVDRLLKDCSALPAHGSVAELKEGFQQLLGRHLARPAELNEDENRLSLVWEALDRAFETLVQLDAIGDDLTWAEFVELLTHVLERTVVPFARTDHDHDGVTVLDAMAARGVRFKALFVLGLNEKLFPRYIREDPFLRDRHRRVLDETLGFKIDEKLAGYEEEVLLLTLLQQAAAERLLVSFQRADEHGRAMAPSPYLEDVARQCGVEQPPVEIIPRRVTDRLAQRPTMRAFLPPEDLAVWMAISGQDVAPMLAAVDRDAASYRHGANILSRLENETPSLTACDGLTGTLDAHWARTTARGMAPTPLERYARCPFQYFAADVLRLEPIRQPAGQALDASLLGTVCHAALRRCYEQLIATGWPAEPVTDDTVAWCIHSSVEEAAAEAEARYRTGHYVLWELAKDMIIGLVAAAVEADQAAQAEDPFIPVAFEVDAEGVLPTAEEAAPIKIHGRMDRIDRRPDSGEVRVIDYKFKIGTAMKAEDRHLIQSALRGYRLQPPLYACLDLPGLPKPSQVQLFFLAPHWPTPIVRSTFETAAWDSDTGIRLHRTLDTLLEGIQAGRFYIAPGTYCDTCDFRVSCRSGHTPTWWRATRAPEASVLNILRTQRVKDE